jgi:hypothetical protein
MIMSHGENKGNHIGKWMTHKYESVLLPHMERGES